MVDTGDFASVSLSSEALDQLPVKPKGRRVHRDATGALLRVRTFVLPTLRLGGLELHDVPGIENLTSPYDDDGTIGAALLGRFNALFDYRGGAITLFRRGARPETIDEPGWFVFPLPDPLTLPVRFDPLDRTYSIGLDSGCGSTLVPAKSSLGRALYTNLGEADAQRVTDSLTGETVLLYHVDHCLLDDAYDLDPTTCAVSGRPGYLGNGLMGYDVFWHNTVFFDQAESEMWLRPAQE